MYVPLWMIDWFVPAFCFLFVMAGVFAGLFWRETRDHDKTFDRYIETANYYQDLLQWLDERRKSCPGDSADGK